MKNLIVVAATILLAGCQTGVYELETPDRDISVSYWSGSSSDGQPDLFRLNGKGKIYTGAIDLNKEDPDAWTGDMSGMSGFLVTIDDMGMANFECTRSKTDDKGKQSCTRFEVNKSTITKLPIGTEYRK